MSRVSRNIVFNLMGQALIVTLAFVATRVVYHRLGEDALGILFFAIAICALFSPVLDMGVGSTVVREVAGHWKTDTDYVLRLVRTSTLFYWATYAILAAAIWWAAPWLVFRWVTLKTLSPVVGVRALRLLVLGGGLMPQRSLYTYLLRGIERMDLSNLIAVGVFAFQQFGTILVVIRGGGLVEVGYVYLASRLVGIAAYIAVASRFFSWRALRPGFSWDVIRRNWPFARGVGASLIFAAVQTDSDKAILSKLVPAGLLGFYGVAQEMVARTSGITAAVVQAAFPNLSALFHDGDWNGLLRQYRRLQDLVCYGLVPVFVAIIFAARLLFSYLLDAKAAQILQWPTILLCVGWYMNATLNIPSIFSLAAGRPDISARQNFYALFLITPAEIWLIWKWGLTGAGVSVVLYHLYASSYGARRISSECLGIPLRDWYLHVLKILALASATYGIAWLALAAGGGGSIASLALAYALASPAYLCAAYMLMGQELREGLDVCRGKVARGVLRYIHSS